MTEPLYLPANERVEVIRDYAKRYGLRNFIESGTSSGETTYALINDFDDLWTIELDADVYLRAVHRFAPFGHVGCTHGDSGKVLTRIVPTLKAPAIFWLDGHYCGPGSAHGDLDSPIVAELEAAANAPKGSVILVDDARIFEEGPEHEDEPHYHDYPKLSWVKKTMEAKGFEYELKDDIVRLTPKEA